MTPGLILKPGQKTVAMVVESAATMGFSQQLANQINTVSVTDVE
jgi:hypothetical protein